MNFAIRVATLFLKGRPRHLAIRFAQYFVNIHGGTFAIQFRNLSCARWVCKFGGSIRNTRFEITVWMLCSSVFAIIFEHSMVQGLQFNLLNDVSLIQLLQFRQLDLQCQFLRFIFDNWLFNLDVVSNCVVRRWRCNFRMRFGLLLFV